MNILRALAVLLLAGNVGFYIWVAQSDAGVGYAPQAQPPVNREGMQLLHETQAATRAADAAQENDSSVRPPPPTRLCYRIGAFQGAESAWQSANGYLGAQQFAYRAVRGESRQMRAVEVYLAGFDSRASAAPMMAWLDERGIANFVGQDDDGRTRISLGYFTQESLASRFVAHMQSLGVEAESRVSYRELGPLNWLETSIDPLRSEELLAHAWGDGVSVVEIDCDDLPGALGTGV